MMRRRLLSVIGAAILAMALMATPALAAHCINHSKPAGAGNHGYIVLDATTEEIVAVSDGPMTPSGRFKGGFVDVWIDVNSDQIGDFLAVSDTYVAANHALKPGDPFVVPGAFHNPSDHGIGLAH